MSARYTDEELAALRNHECPDCGRSMQQGLNFWQCPDAGCGYFIRKSYLEEKVTADEARKR